jgi:hypothetical protein
MKLPRMVRSSPCLLLGGGCALVAVAAASCGGQPSATSMPDSNHLSAPNDTQSVGDENTHQVTQWAALNPACPDDPIVAGGTPCTTKGMECEYGTNDATYCDTVLHCDGKQWLRSVPEANQFACTWEQQLPDEACPSTYSRVPVGATCADPGSPRFYCHYAEGNCACADEVVGVYPPPTDDRTRMRWICPLLADGCPQTRPRLGATCSSEGTSCSYGACLIPGTSNVTCSGGRWGDSSVCLQ